MNPEVAKPGDQGTGQSGEAKPAEEVAGKSEAANPEAKKEAAPSST